MVVPRLLCFVFLLLALTFLPRAVWAFEVRVCVRPPDVPKNVGKWAYPPKMKIMFITPDNGEFMSKSQSYVVYVYDPWAPPDSVKYLPDKWQNLGCPRPPAPPKPVAPPAPKPADSSPKKEEKPKEAGPPAGSGEKPPTPEELAKREEERRRWDGRGPTVGTRPLPKEEDEGVLSDHYEPPKDYKDEPDSPVEYKGGLLPALKEMKDEKRPMLSVQSCHQTKAGCKPQKTTFQKVVEQVVIGGAIFNLQMGHDLHPADGQPFGIIGGMNANGPNDPVLQAVAAAVLLTPTQQLGNAFMRRVAKAWEKGEKVVVKELSELTEEAAEELAGRYKEDLAKALADVGAIGPYKVWKKFTENWGGRWQAHHILEKAKLKFLKGKPDPDLIPSVILSEAEHKKITAELAERMKEVRGATDLWQAYSAAYKNHPEWLKAIEDYFK